MWMWNHYKESKVMMIKKVDEPKKTQMVPMYRAKAKVVCDSMAKILFKTLSRKLGGVVSSQD